MTGRGGVVCALLTIDRTERLSTTHVQELMHTHAPRKATMKISIQTTLRPPMQPVYSLLLARGKYHDKPSTDGARSRHVLPPLTVKLQELLLPTLPAPSSPPSQDRPSSWPSYVCYRAIS